MVIMAIAIKYKNLDFFATVSLIDIILFLKTYELGLLKKTKMSNFSVDIV